MRTLAWADRGPVLEFLVAVVLPLGLLAALWAALNGLPIAEGRALVGLSSGRVLFALGAGLVSLLLLVVGLMRRPSAPATSMLPLLLLFGYGLVGLVAGLIFSPDRLLASLWAWLFLGVVAWGLMLQVVGTTLARKLTVTLSLGIVLVLAFAMVAFTYLNWPILQSALDGELVRVFLAGQFEPPTSFFIVNSNGVARFVAVSVLALSLPLLAGRSFRARAAAFALMLPLFVVLVFSLSRSAVVGLGVAFLALAILLKAIRWNAFASRALVGVAGVATIGWVALTVFETRGFGTVSTGGGRTHVWVDALGSMGGSPIIGYGFNSDRMLLREHIHDAWLQSLHQAGLLGLLLFAGAIAATWYLVFRLGVFQGFASFEPSTRRRLSLCTAILVFLSLRTIPESTGALYGVDLLLLVPIVAYVQHAHASLASSNRAPTLNAGDERGNPAPLRILAGAFACKPPESRRFRGGEELLGWRMVQQIARTNHVVVLTEETNRRDLRGKAGPTGTGSLEFHYVRFPRMLQRLRHVQVGIQLYAYLWQWKATLDAFWLHERHQFQAYHHITYANDWMASPIGALLRIPFVRGPGGSGPRVPKPLLRSLGTREAAWQGSRMLMRRAFRMDPFYSWSQRRASHLLVCNLEALERLPRAQRAKAEVMPVTGLVPEEFANGDRRGNGGFRVVTAGKLLSTKGGRLTMQAFAAAARSHDDMELTVIGDGPERRALEALAADLGIRDRVRFVGWLPRRADVLQEMRRGNVFLYPSFHDGGGAVVVEAMAQRLPVITLDIGGPSLHVTPGTGIKVPASDPAAAVRDLSGWLLFLAERPGLCSDMGTKARERARSAYLWSDLGTQVQRCYDRVARETRGVAA